MVFISWHRDRVRVGEGPSESDPCRSPIRSRIFFSGQSMGGMSALQFATPDPTSRPCSQRQSCRKAVFCLLCFCRRYFLGSLRPAAVAACSPGGSRNNDLELQGQVPTLLLQGRGVFQLYRTCKA